MPSKRQVFEEIEYRLSRSPKKMALWTLIKTGHPVPIVVLFEKTRPQQSRPDIKPMNMQKYVGANVSTLNKILALYDYRVAPGDPRATYVLRPL